jgi:uncharacterized membrane protein YheB (UPF0754 family)
LKLNIEVEIDWAGDGEDGINPDQVVKNEIVNAIIRKMSDTFQKQVESEAMSLVRERLNEVVSEMLTNFMERPVIITDRYGDVKEKHENVKEMVKEEFDNFLTARVDNDGRELGKDRCGYGGNSCTRVEWLIHKRVDTQAHNFVAKVVQEVDAQINKSLDKAFKEKVSAALMKKLDITEVVQAK